MGNVTVFTKTRAQAVEDSTVVSGQVTSGALILTRKNGSTVNAGSVIGPKGDTGSPGLTPIALSSTTNLDSLKTPGLYVQSTAANATSALNYPATTSGNLMVFGSGSLYAQHYTTFNVGPYAGTLWVRSCDSNGTWSAWKIANAPGFTQEANSDTLLLLTTTLADISGAAITVTSLGPNDSFVVVGTFEATSLGTTATTGVGRLVVDGNPLTRQVLWSNGGISGLRGMQSQTWIVSGLSAGDHIFKLAASRSGGADSMIRVNAVHTNIVVTRQ